VWQEKEADAQVGFAKKAVAELLNLRREKFVRDLRRDARSVSRLGVRIDGTPMGEVTKRLQGVFQHLIGALAAALSDAPDAAGIVVEIRRVERRAAG